jgi:hypothetical protein
MNSMSISEQRTDTSFRDRLASKSYLASLDRRSFASDTKVKYNAYEDGGKAIFVVTLSTYVKSDKIAKSDAMRKFWVREFLHRVIKQSPLNLKGKIDYDYVIERSPDGHYHYHGLLAMSKEGGDKIWQNGVLNKELARDLTALRTKGQYRDFAVNTFLVEPIRPDQTINTWVNYMTKTKDYISSSAW